MTKVKIFSRVGKVWLGKVDREYLATSDMDVEFFTDQMNEFLSQLTEKNQPISIDQKISISPLGEAACIQWVFCTITYQDNK